MNYIKSTVWFWKLHTWVEVLYKTLTEIMMGALTIQLAKWASIQRKD
jgi:hypothetical protein